MNSQTSLWWFRDLTRTSSHPWDQQPPESNPFFLKFLKRGNGFSTDIHYYECPHPYIDMKNSCKHNIKGNTKINMHKFRLWLNPNKNIYYKMSQSNNHLEQVIHPPYISPALALFIFNWAPRLGNMACYRVLSKASLKITRTSLMDWDFTSRRSSLQQYYFLCEKGLHCFLGSFQLFHRQVSTFFSFSSSWENQVTPSSYFINIYDNKFTSWVYYISFISSSFMASHTIFLVSCRFFWH